MQSEAVAVNQHLFYEFLTFYNGVRRERKGAMDKRKVWKDHGAVDKPSSK